MSGLLKTARWRDIALGAAAGVVGGLAFGLALQANDMMENSLGLVGLTTLRGGLILHYFVSAIVGAGFGALFGHQLHSYAATISNGVLYGLLWWVVGPLTLAPLLMGQGPTWTLDEAGAAFFNIVGHILYGGLTGVSFYLLKGIATQWWPEDEAASVDTPPRKRVVILGGGFGGVSAAQRLEQLTGREQRVEVTLVSQSNYLLYTPMLAGVAASALEAQHISAPIRAACPRTRFVRGAVETIDVELQTVRVVSGYNLADETLHYDHLVLALGSVPNFHGLPGMQQHAFSLKTLEDAMHLRNHVIAMLERADVEPDVEERERQLTFVVAGGGFAGTEMIAELFDLAHSVRRYYPHIEAGAMRFVLVHSRDRILPELSLELAEYSLEKLRARGIEFILNARVAQATADAVTLQDGRSIPTRTVVWTAGNQPHPLLSRLPYEQNHRGAIVTGDDLGVNHELNVWAIGDCADIPDAHNPGESYPPTAQHALREGKVVAENIVAVLAGREPKTFRFRTIGLLVALGHRMGAAEIGGRRFSGLLAWLMWRGIYLSKLPGLEKKVRVLLDWTIDLLFPRDIVLTVDTSVQPAQSLMQTEAENYE